MPERLFLYIGAALPLLWGVSHLFPTVKVIKGFGEISADNKNIIAMEWIIEGVSLIFIGVIVAGVTAVDSTSNASSFVYVASAIMLLAMAVVSLFTGFKVNFFPFKLCPFLFTISAILIFLGH